ncbi:MAG: NADH:ubiquinone reductase (Na(+)-transporting) subunit F [Bacteroidales bacterium]|nr:NADH:ubiquinone reductase (Na(+)-transporting) subunit F [Bacteroidales bacterium]
MTTTTLLAALLVMLTVIILLVAVLLLLRNRLLPTGNVTIDINGDRQMQVPTGNSLISTLAEQKIYLPSACGGKGSCGQCKCRVLEGGGSILPTEMGFFSRKQQQEGWRLGCQVKVKENMRIALPPSILSIKKYECTVVSNRNVATFIKEFKVQLPPGEHMDFTPGSYAQIEIPKFDISYNDYDRSLITDEYLPAWEKFGMFGLRCVNTEPTTRAYSMANYPAEGDVFMLTVRIATPPFKPDRSGFMDVNPGIASSYIFSLKPGDKVVMSGPYGEFHVKEHPSDKGDKPEMIWVGGGAGMAPLRAQIMHMTRTLHTTDRTMHYFYGARALNEVFYLNDFHQLEKEFPNFHFHLALDRPDPTADAAGVPYTAGFVHDVMYETYLKDHPTPEDIEYYMCGPGPMSAAVVNMLDSLGVPSENILYDDFGGSTPKGR